MQRKPHSKAKNDASSRRDADMLVRRIGTPHPLIDQTNQIPIQHHLHLIQNPAFMRHSIITVRYGWSTSLPPRAEMQNSHFCLYPTFCTVPLLLPQPRRTNPRAQPDKCIRTVPPRREAEVHALSAGGSIPVRARRRHTSRRRLLLLWHR